MEVGKTLGCYKYTRRFKGRRALTPMRSKHKCQIKKTRGHRVEKRPHVPLLKHTGSLHDGEWKEEDQSQLGHGPQWQGDQDSHNQGGEEDTKEHAQVESVRNTENSEKSIHPGPVQTLPDMSEQSADDQTLDKTEIEAEELQ
jgi:hypothetical protein